MKLKEMYIILGAIYSKLFSLFPLPKMQLSHCDNWPDNKSSRPAISQYMYISHKKLHVVYSFENLRTIQSPGLSGHLPWSSHPKQTWYSVGK